MKIILNTILLLLLSSQLQAQDKVKQNLYFLLDNQKIDYTKKVVQNKQTDETKREYDIYSFSLRCTCHETGYLEYFGHSNKQYSDNKFDHIKLITEKDYKKLKFISFDDLISLVKKYDTDWNTPHILYFVEASSEIKGKYLIYHVRSANDFVKMD